MNVAAQLLTVATAKVQSLVAMSYFLELVSIFSDILYARPYANVDTTATAMLEFQIPPVLSKWAPFLFSFLGRGICKDITIVCLWLRLISKLVYIFVGSILLHDGVLRIIVGSIIGIVGLGYGVLEYIPSIEPPENMRDANAESWGAEQI